MTCGWPGASERGTGDPRRVQQLVLTRAGVVAPVRVDPTGRSGPTKNQARGPRWTRSSAGLYVPADVRSDAPEQRIVEAVAGAPEGSAATGWAALAWLGARWFSGFAADGRTPLPVPVAVGDRDSPRDRPGVAYSADWLFDDDVVRIDGLPVTAPERSVTYEARRAGHLIGALRAIDMALAADLVDLETLTAYAARLVARDGVRLLRTALGWANENVWSPQEVPMRVHWRRATGRPLACNQPVFDARGRFLLTPDLLDVGAGVAGEYDGAVHLEDGRRRKDLDREEIYRDHRIEVVTMMSSRHDDVQRFLARLRAAYGRAAERRHLPRTWTVEQPPWWVDTSTVARRRALSADDRARWLRRRT